MSAETHESIGVVVMRRKCIVWYFLASLLYLHFESFRTNVIAEETGHEYLKGCAHLQCERGSHCIKRRFWCKNPPCPGMLYCSKSRKESLRGPLTCDSVRCSSGHTCVVRVRGCRWDKKCQQQIARCVSEKEYHDGEVSCASFECPLGKRCILRESHCVSSPCKLIKSCAEAKDVQIWFDKCRALDCLSEYECFLRRPDDDCLNTSCAHTPDCILTAEGELISRHCRGWICPRMQKCVARIVGSCKGFNCTIERSCQSVSSNLSAKHNTFASIETEGWSTEKTLVEIETEVVHQETGGRKINRPTRYPITRKKTTMTAASTRKQLDYTTSHRKYGTEIPVIPQQITTKSSSIVGSADLLSTRPYSLLFYPRFCLNPDKLPTMSTVGNEMKIEDQDNIFATTSRFSDCSRESSLSTFLFSNQRFESTTPRDTTKLEMLKKIYVTANDIVLPVALEDINLAWQGYPIWIENKPYRPPPLRTEEEDESGWRYHAPQELYRILLSPYEPVLIEDTRQRQLHPFSTYALGHPFNEAALLSLQGIPFQGIRNFKINGSPTNVVNRISNDTNISATIGTRNLKTNRFDDSSGNYANLRTMKKTNIVPPNISGQESDNYYDDYERPWIHDYLEKSELQSDHKRELTSSIDEFATDKHRNETQISADVKTIVRGKIEDENGRRISDAQYTYRHNKNLATFDSIQAYALTGQSDYNPEKNDEKRYGLADHPYDKIAVHDVDKSREHLGSSLNQILGISQNQESTTFSFGELDERKNGRPTTTFLHETSPYRTYNGNNQKNDDREYDEYYSYESYDNISGVETTGS